MISAGQNKCLRNVAALASSNAEWADYAAYCTDRERGLRRPAFQHLDCFLVIAQSWTVDERKEFVNWLCMRLAEFGESDGYGLIPRPLVDQLIFPTLGEWAEVESKDATPCRWLGLFFGGVAYSGMRAGLSHGTIDAYSHLRAALERDPFEQLARVRVIEMLVGDAEYSCHHLPDYYIGDPAGDSTRLAEASKHLTLVRDREHKNRLQSELDHVAQLIDDWVSFTDSGEPDFNQWCVDRGRTYQWIKSFYYTPKGT